MADPTADRTGELRDVAASVVELARKAGAKEAEAFVERSREASASVRAGEIEELTEASSKGIGLRVIMGGRLGFAATTDLNRASLETLVERALALAKEAAPDPANVLATEKELGLGDRPRVDRLYDPAVASLDPGWKLRVAFEMEKAARAEDPRCDNFEGSGAGEAMFEYAIASSHGLVDSERGTHAYLWCSPVARSGESLQTSSWSDHKRHLAELDSAESVGREAARRTVRMLGARKIDSARIPVVFDPMMAAGFFGSICAAVNGELVYRRTSFLANKLGELVASPQLTMIDDARIPGALGSSAFDGEGVPTRARAIIEKGKLASFLYDVRTARKAGKRTTGHARRGYSSLPSIGPSNLRVQPGTQTAQEIIKSVPRGLYVTTMLGRGADVITGDYSRGANGLWIENGELTYPVQEVTVGGSLLQMLQSIDAIGSDLTVRGSVGAPTVRFVELAVGGR